MTNGLTGKPSINVIVIFGITTNPVAKNMVPMKNNNANNLGFCNFAIMNTVLQMQLKHQPHLQSIDLNIDYDGGFLDYLCPACNRPVQKDIESADLERAVACKRCGAVVEINGGPETQSLTACYPRDE